MAGTNVPTYVPAVNGHNDYLVFLGYDTSKVLAVDLTTHTWYDLLDTDCGAPYQAMTGSNLAWNLNTAYDQVQDAIHMSGITGSGGIARIVPTSTAGEFCYQEIAVPYSGTAADGTIGVDAGMTQPASGVSWDSGRGDVCHRDVLWPSSPLTCQAGGRMRKKNSSDAQIGRSASRALPAWTELSRTRPR